MTLLGLDELPQPDARLCERVTVRSSIGADNPPSLLDLDLIMQATSGREVAERGAGAINFPFRERLVGHPGRSILARLREPKPPRPSHICNQSRTIALVLWTSPETPANRRAC